MVAIATIIIIIIMLWRCCGVVVFDDEAELDYDLLYNNGVAEQQTRVELLFVRENSRIFLSLAVDLYRDL